MPLGCFLAAAVLEIRSREKGPTFVVRMAEIAAGLIALYASTRTASYDVLSWGMVGFSLLLGALSLVSHYSSRGSRFCMLWGSALLAFLWYFKGAYHAVFFTFAASTLLFLLSLPVSVTI